MPPLILWKAVTRERLGMRDKNEVVRRNHRWAGPRPCVCSLLRPRRGAAAMALVCALHRQRARDGWLLLAAAERHEAVFGSPAQNRFVPVNGFPEFEGPHPFSPPLIPVARFGDQSATLESP
jgi:hypothetical protein